MRLFYVFTIETCSLNVRALVRALDSESARLALARELSRDVRDIDAQELTRAPSTPSA